MKNRRRKCFGFLPISYMKELVEQLKFDIRELDSNEMKLCEKDTGYPKRMKYRTKYCRRSVCSTAIKIMVPKFDY